jgi:hypothetical protein
MLRLMTFALPFAALLAATLPDGTTAQTVPAEGQPPLSERAPHVAEMLETMRIYDVVEIMATEGVEASMTLETEMFPGDGGAAWAAEINRIHGSDRMTAIFEEAFPVEAMTEAQARRVTQFFSSEPGESIAAAELATRRSFLDPEVEEAANAAFRDAVEAEDPRIDLLTEFIEANDLVERNVSGALNSNFAFYRGLTDGDAFEVEIPEDLMLQEVWGQEAELRRDTVEWLYSFQLAAYEDLSDADLEAYIAMSETEAGQALNAALFTAFDAMFEALSYEIGHAAATFILGEDA